MALYRYPLAWPRAPRAAPPAAMTRFRRAGHGPSWEEIPAERATGASGPPLGLPVDDWVLAAERACGRLVVWYAHLVDLGDPAQVADLFTDDGVWAGPSRRFVGRDEIREGFRRRGLMRQRLTRHVCSPILVTVTGAGQATGVTNVVLYGGQRSQVPGQTVRVTRRLVGEYRDSFRCSNGDWLFDHREAVIVFADPGRDIE